MNCNVHVFCKMMTSNKFEFILEIVFSHVTLLPLQAPPTHHKFGIEGSTKVCYIHPGGLRPYSQIVN
jgi:hypothetical protein